MAATLRGEIGPAVDEPFAKTQAFMASVVLAKLAGQLRRRRGRRARSPTTSGDALVTDARGRSSPRHRRPGSAAAVDALERRRRRPGLEPPRRAALRRPATSWATTAFDAVLGTRARRAAGPARPSTGLRRDEPRRASRSRSASATTSPTASAPPTCELHDVQRIAVGWSHETWLFDAIVDGGRRTGTPRGSACGATRATRCCGRCPTSACSSTCCRRLDDTAVPTPTPYFYEADTGRPRRAVPRHGEGARRRARARGGATAAASTRRPRPAACCPTASPTRSSPSTPSTGGRPASTCSASPSRAPTSPAGRSPSGGR